jgi:hypothetical protein
VTIINIVILLIFLGIIKSPGTIADTNIFTGSTRLGPKFFNSGQRGNDTQAGDTYS